MLNKDLEKGAYYISLLYEGELFIVNTVKKYIIIATLANIAISLILKFV